jgi:very-short-patch-repair endonuclease
MACTGLRYRLRWLCSSAAPSARPSHKQINSWLTASARLPGPAHERALGTWDKFGDSFDDINLATALGLVARRSARAPSAQRTALFHGALGDSLRRLLTRLASRVDVLGPRELANVMHSASALNHDDACALVRSGAVRARALASQLTPQGLCLATRACAKAGVRDVPLLHAVSAAAQASKMARFSPQDFSTLVWAFATLDKRDDALFAKVAAMVPHKLEREPASTQALANIAWACARLSANCPDLLDAISRHALARVDEFKPFELTMLLWALARSERADAALFDAAAAALERNLERLPPQSISNAAWAYATADICPDSLFRAIAARVPARLETFSPQALVNLGWSFCVCGFFPAQLMRELVRRIELIEIGPSTPFAYLQQLTQIDNALAYDAPELVLRLEPALVDVCARAVRAQHLARRPSNLHMRISDTLRLMAGMEHQNEAIVPPYGYFVDIALPQLNLVLEVKGAAGGRGSARHLVKYRHLRKAGWRVLLVTDHEWDALGADHARRAAFLAERIAMATAHSADALAARRSPIVWGADEQGERSGAREGA